MFIRFILSTVVVLALSIASPTSVWAEPAISVSGFGTFGYAISDNSEDEYKVGSGIDGATDSGTLKLDSRFGIQFDTNLNPYLSGTLQALSRQNYKGEFTPEVEWAFLKGQVSDSVSIRVGRMGAPFFMVSDFREVGYANTTLRPPEDTYIQVPLRVFNGADINGLYEIGNTIVSGQAFIGQRERRFPSDITINLKDTMGVNLAFERGVARLRFSYIDTRAGVNSPGYQSLNASLTEIAQLMPELVEIAENFNGRPNPSTFTSAGLELELDPLFLAAEYTQRRIKKSAVASFNAWYVTTGFRWNNFTPYATYSQIRQVSKTDVALPPVPQLAELQAAISAYFSAGDQTTIAAGVRWDLFESASLKLQFENISRDSLGVNFGSGLGSGEDVKLVSFAMDFTF